MHSGGVNAEMIMIVDDNLFGAKLLEAFLVCQRFNTRVFTNPLSALNWYAMHHRQVGLVFLDIHMPQLSGPECFQDIIVINPNVKVAFLSNERDPCVWADLVARGDGIAFFSKPLDYHSVADWSREMLFPPDAERAYQ